MPATVKVVPELTLNVPWLEPNATPLLAFIVKSAVDCNVPPFKVRWPAVADPGADPKPLSALMLIVPEFIVVVPA